MTSVSEQAPLVLTDDDLLRSELLRLAAAAGTVPEVVRESAAALRCWATAPLVLVGADKAATMASTRPPRRPGVHVVGTGPIADEVFRDALGCGAESVAELPASGTWLVELLTDVVDGAAAPGLLVGVVGGCGGAGATVLAAALARERSRHGRTLALDADILGPGLDRVLGMEGHNGVRWDALLQTTGRLGARSLRDSVPCAGRLGVLGWPAERPAALPPFAVREVLSAAVRGHDSVVVDLPRHPDPMGEELLARCDRVVLVCTLTVAGVAAATRVAARLPGAVPAHLVTRGSAHGVAPEEVSRILRLPLAVAMRDQRGLDEAIDLGAGPGRSARGPLARAARTVSELLDERAARSAA